METTEGKKYSHWWLVWKMYSVVFQSNTTKYKRLIMTGHYQCSGSVACPPLLNLFGSQWKLDTIFRKNLPHSVCFWWSNYLFGRWCKKMMCTSGNVYGKAEEKIVLCTTFASTWAWWIVKSRADKTTQKENCILFLLHRIKIQGFPYCMYVCTQPHPKLGNAR